MATNPEALLISAVLTTQGYQRAAAAGIGSDVFHAYQDEWDWINRYFVRYRRTPTAVVFQKHFPEFRLKKVDDIDYLCDEVRKSHVRHMLTNTMRDMTDLISEGQIDQAVSVMRKTMTVAASSVGAIKDTDILDDYAGVYSEVLARKKAYDENGMAGFPTGFETIDERTGGVQRGQSWIIGARLGEGKSWILLRMACSAVIAGHNVQFDALEMSRSEVGMRMHNFLSSSVGKQIFQSQALSMGKDFDIKLYKQFLRDLKGTIKGKFHVSDDRKIGIEEIASQIERNKPDMLFLDYLTLAKTHGDGGWQDIGKFSKDLKIAAGQYGIAIVSAAQLNRTNGLGKDVPGAEALGQSDQIGQDADAVINIKRRSEHVVEGKMSKYRHGRSGYTFWLHQDMEQGILREVSYNAAQDIRDADRDREALEKENSR